MVKKSKISPLTTALGASFTISLALSPIAHATDNPFEVTSLSSGYMVADGHEGKCGEGKCGDKKSSDSKKDKKEGEGKCCLLYTSPSPRDLSTSRMPSSA